MPEKKTQIGRPRKYNYAEVAADYERGLRIQEIADKYGIKNTASVIQIAHAERLKLRGYRRPVETGQTVYVYSLTEQGRAAIEESTE